MSWKNSLALTGPSFKPTDIPGLQNWWHAGFENTVTLVGSRVSEWRDLLRGVPASTVTAGTRPEYVRNAQNGKNALFFNGSELLVSNANRPAAARHTIVGAVRAFTPPGGDSSPFSVDGAATIHGLSNMLWYTTAAGGYITTTSSLGTAMRTVGYTNAAARVSLYMDGVFLNAGQAGTQVSTAAGLTIGRRRNGIPGFFPGYICELLYYTRDLTRPEMSQLQMYFDREWQITTAGLAVDAIGSPLEIPNCQLWLDASDLSTLKQNNNGTGTVSRIGDPVGYWGNKGPQATWNATEPAAALKPVLAEGAPGRRGLLFSHNQRLTISSLDAGTPATVLVACVPYGVTEGASGRVFDTGSRQTLHQASAGYQAGNSNFSFFVGARGRGQTSVGAIRFAGRESVSILDRTTTYFGIDAAHSNTFSGGLSIGWASWNGLTSSSNFGGLILELAVFNRALTISEMQQATRYLQDKWGAGVVRPVAGHPEAQAWIDRVYLNGGFVSQYTADRVSHFCYRIDQAGLRSRFHRLNLFCGGNLPACLTPLYLGPSATQRSSGFVYETNSNFSNFSRLDYTELGGLGGLKGNASNTTLDTGFSTDILANLAPNIHLSYYCNQPPTSIDTNFIRTGQPAGGRFYGLNFGGANTGDQLGGWSGLSIFTPAFPGQRLITRDAVGTSIYRNGSLATSVNATLPPEEYPRGNPIRLFGGRIGNNAPDNVTDARVQAYSIGESFNATQAQHYATIMEEFQRSLGRGIDIYASQFPEITHADVLSWLTRVHSNGGVVDAATAGHVQTFCNAVDAAGLRDRFYRLNLFCGSNLAACLTPLYRGTSVTGSQFGSPSDTNSGFLNSDFTNSTGLGTTTTGKTIGTNVLTTALPQVQNSHLAMSIANGSIVTGARFFGVGLSNQTFMWYAEVNTSANSFTGAATSNAQSIGVSGVSAYARWCVSRTSNSSHVLYRNGQSVASNSATIPARTATASQLSGWTLSGGLGVGTAALRLNYYSFGDGLTGAQAATLDGIFSAFMTATGRT